MAYTTPASNDLSDLMTKLLKEKKIARRFVERRHVQWDENYELYRNVVKTNRLTQRQAVQIPLMKETVKTLLSKIDDPPQVDWKEMSGDQAKEMVFQEKWNFDAERLNFEGIDLQDKKTVLLYGRSFKKLNWVDGNVTITPLDIYDVVIDPLVDPIDIETARFIIHQNIFRSLRDILADERYSADGKTKLKTYLASKDGVIQSNDNKEEYNRRVERLKSMGVLDSDFALFGAGDVVVNLSEHHTKIWDSSTKKFERRVVVYADDCVELMNESLMDLLGIDFYPFVSWSDDVETADFWSDGPADLVRTPNKIINIWFSQLIENRTLRNFQMFWYDSSRTDWVPQTYEPGPGKMLPAPSAPRDSIMPVDIQGLDETMNSIEFLIRIIERGSGATSTDKGTSEKKQITLGEVEMLVGKAMERTVSMAKFYRRSWQELAMKYYKLVEANDKKVQTLYKMGSDHRLWPKKISPIDWRSPVGYMPIVRSSSEQEAEQQKSLQNIIAVRQQYPNNPALNRIIQQRLLTLIDLTPEEMQEVKQMQDQIDQAMMMQAQGTMPGAEAAPPGEPPAPEQPASPTQAPQTDALIKDVQSRIAQLRG